VRCIQWRHSCPKAYPYCLKNTDNILGMSLFTGSILLFSQTAAKRGQIPSAVIHFSFLCLSISLCVHFADQTEKAGTGAIYSYLYCISNSIYPYDLPLKSYVCSLSKHGALWKEPSWLTPSIIDRTWPILAHLPQSRSPIIIILLFRIQEVFRTHAAAAVWMGSRDAWVSSCGTHIHWKSAQ